MRRFLVASIAAFAALSVAPFVSAQTLKVVMHSDVKIIDPIWSGAYITRNYGYMLYDTLFAVDEKLAVKPQMVDSWKTSDDGLTWTFTLRDGLEWHDGQPVTAEDCVASLKRWSARDSMGQKLASYGADYRIVDARTFQIVLKEKFGLLLEALGKPSVVVPFMMPKRVAETDPFKQIDEMIGSGPFTLNKADWKPGEKLTFHKNRKYKPRPEPMSGLSGGKVVKLDTVEWVWIPDAETQINALINGEIDMIESPSFDHVPVIEKTRGLANVGDKRFYRVCKAMFTCESPLASTAGTEGLIEGNYAKAKELLAEAKYDGTPVVMPQPTDLGVIKQIAPVAKSQLEKAGFKVEVQPMDWQSMVTRLNTKKGPPSEGGWSAYGTSWSQLDILDPLMTPNLISTCEKARSGWPCDEKMEKLRDNFVRAVTLPEKKAAADAVQIYAMQVITHVPLGEWFAVSAASDKVEFPTPLAPVTVFWGISKK